MVSFVFVVVVVVQRFLKGYWKNIHSASRRQRPSESSNSLLDWIDIYSIMHGCHSVEWQRNVDGNRSSEQMKPLSSFVCRYVFFCPSINLYVWWRWICLPTAFFMCVSNFWISEPGWMEMDRAEPLRIIITTDNRILTNISRPAPCLLNIFIFLLFYFLFYYWLDVGNVSITIV